MKFKSQIKLSKEEIVEAILDFAKKKTTLPLEYDKGIKWDINGGQDPYDANRWDPYSIYSVTIDVTMEAE